MLTILVSSYYYYNIELEWVQNAFYTEPGDQSAWLYYRWLIDKSKLNDDPSGIYLVHELMSDSICISIITSTVSSLPSTQTSEDKQKQIFTQELQKVQELLEQEPNSKCTYSFPH